MYRISYILKNSRGSINNGTQMVRDIVAMLDQVIKFKNLKIVGKVREKSSEEEVFRQVLAKIRHVANVVVNGANLRTICAPDDELKATQRKILSRLDGIPSHRSAHGFVRDRDSMTCASAHTSYWGEKPSSLVILNMDAKNFFPSITSQVVRKALEANRVAAGDVDLVISSCMARADERMAMCVVDGLVHLMMKGLLKSSARDISDEKIMSVHAEMKSIFDHTTGVVMPDGTSKKIAFAICQGFLSLGPSVTMVNKFLPQGAPTSPFLSNMAMKVVDIRLSAMAASFGGFYTRYADDFTISWMTPTKGKVIDGMYRCTTEVIKEYGIVMNRQKKRVMGTGVRQEIVGLCVNSGIPTISRRKRMKIRAAIHNEVVRGSAGFRSGRRPPARFESYANDRPDFKRVCYLMGHIGHISSAHRGEASRYLSVMRNVMNPVATRMAGHTIHPTHFEHAIEGEGEGRCGVGGFFFHQVEIDGSRTV